MQAMAAQTSKVPAGKEGVHFHGCEVHSWGSMQPCRLLSAQTGKHQGTSITCWKQLSRESPRDQGNDRQAAKLSLSVVAKTASIHE